MLVILSWGKLDRPWVLKAFYWPVCGTPLGPKTLTHSSRDTVGRARFTVLWSLAFETVLLLTNVTPQGRPWKEEWKEGRMRELSDPIRATPAILSFWVRTEPWSLHLSGALQPAPSCKLLLSFLGFPCVPTGCVSQTHITPTAWTQTSTDPHPGDIHTHTVIRKHPRPPSPQPPLRDMPTSPHLAGISHSTALEKETPLFWSLCQCTLSTYLPGQPHCLQCLAPRPLAWDPMSCLTQEPRQPTIESVSGQDLFLGKKLLTLQQLSIFRGSPQKAWRWLVQAWPPEQPSPGRQGHGRESWVLGNKSNHPCLPLGTPHQEAPLCIHISWPSS